MTMQDGERQVAPTIEGIRRDHRARYEFAAKSLKPGSRVIDFACGVGYGAKILADTGHLVHAFDRDEEALAYASEHYAHPLVSYRMATAALPPIFGEFDAAVCFDTIEHVDDPRPLLLAMREAAPTLIASVPNEEWFPYRGYAYHFRHYTRDQFEALLRECGWSVTDWLGQDGPESDVEVGVNGRTLVAVAERDALAEAAPASQDGQAGKHVAILGLGPSVAEYLNLVKRLGGRSKFCDEVWTINALGDVFDCDLIFHMDDVRIQEVRAAAAPGSNIAAMLPWLKRSRVPVMTSRAHPDYPALVEFPLEAVLNNLGHEYFNSTAAYAIAYAIHTGVSRLSVFGMDFSYSNVHKSEKGRACVEYWLGQAHARGMHLSFPAATSLMDSCEGRKARLYGYDTLDVSFQIQPDGTLKLGFTPLESLPSAAEIEARYDHKQHPNPLAKAGIH